MGSSFFVREKDTVLTSFCHVYLKLVHISSWKIFNSLIRLGFKIEDIIINIIICKREIYGNDYSSLNISSRVLYIMNVRCNPIHDTRIGKITLICNWKFGWNLFIQVWNHCRLSLKLVYCLFHFSLHAVKIKFHSTASICVAIKQKMGKLSFLSPFFCCQKNFLYQNLPQPWLNNENRKILLRRNKKMLPVPCYQYFIIDVSKFERHFLNERTKGANDS